MANQYGVTNMGYEARLFVGTAGSTPSSQFTNIRDIKYNLDPQMGDTSTRGDGTSLPVATEKTTGIKPEITFTSLARTTDSTLAALLAAAATGTAMGIRYKNYASGKGYDGDMNVKWENGAPLAGEQTFDFTLTANDQLRDPSVWS